MSTTLDTVSRRSRIIGILIATFGGAATIAIILGIASGAMPVGAAVGIAGANTTLMGIACAVTIPRNTPGLLTIILTSIVLGGIQYALSWFL